MKLLILGYYNRNNLGDDMFKEAMVKVFAGHDCSFFNTDDFKGDVDSYDAIVCGGGDIINDYFIPVIKKIIKGYEKNVFAVGIGLPYLPLIRNGYLDIFDHVFIRERTDLLRLQRRLGSQYAHYLPDLGFILDKPIRTNKNNGTVGVFLPQQLSESKSVIFGLTKFLEYVGSKYKVIFYSFCTSGKNSDDDRILSRNLYETLKEYNDNYSVDDTVYDTYKMIEKIAELDYAICGRFHSHIFSIIAGTPFVSIYSTRKVKLLMDEEDYQWTCPIELTSEGKASKINTNKAIEIFNNMINNSSEISKKLEFIYNRYHDLINTKQISKLIKINQKRPKFLDQAELVNDIEVYQMIRSFLIQKSNFDPENGEPPKEGQINNSVANYAANVMCMKLTKIPGSKYVYGTANNIKTKAHELKEMIKWIYKDFTKDYMSSCLRLNLRYMSQDSFKGLHRAGWQYVIEYMNIFDCPNGVLLDTYVDRTFLWSKLSISEEGLIPYTSPWIGFIHHTPLEKYTNNNCVELIKEPMFIKSLITCKGLITMTEYLANWFRQKLKEMSYDVKVYVMWHPTVFPPNKFTYENFHNNKDKKIVNVGAWYRNPFTIHTFDVPDNIKKSSLKGKDMYNYFNPGNVIIKHNNIINSMDDNLWVRYMKKYIEKNNFFIDNLEKLPEFEINLNNLDIDHGHNYVNFLAKKLKKMIDSVKILEFLPDDEFDNLFSSNIIFIDLLDASAANTIIESMVRNTPLVINKIDPIVEYLGEDYPLYFNNTDEIKYLLTDEKIIETVDYLTKMDKSKLTIENFIESFKFSELYKTLI